MNFQSEIFQINIPLMAHIKAEQFRRYQPHSAKAKQVYLNTLAVSVANSYLNLIGWSTSLEDSDSWNPISQTMMDVADLVIPHYGKLECRAVLSGHEHVVIPPEVGSGRIGYLIIVFDKSLKNAEIIGFIPEVSQHKVLLSQLKSLSKFPAFLSQQPKIPPAPCSNLSNWFSGVESKGWQSLDELFAPPVAMNFRSRSELLVSKDVLEQSRVKLIKLDSEIQETIALILNVRPYKDSEYNVSVTVCNYEHQNHLPDGLELVIIDQVDRPVMLAHANETETIEFCFSGQLGEHFKVEVALNDKFQTENFVI